MILECEHVSKKFAGVQALKDVQFSLKEGEIHCLAGENGCGKSTLIKVLMGTYKPEKGALISFDGQVHAAVTPHVAKDFGMQVIWQDLALFQELTVMENIAFEYYLNKRLSFNNTAQLTAIAKRALAQLGIQLNLHIPLKQLTIAERQLVAVARVLTRKARIIFMDEPTASLGRTESDYLLGIMKKLAQNGVTIVFVTHRLAEVLEVAERVTVLRDGKLAGVFPAAGMTQVRLNEIMSGTSLQHRVLPRVDEQGRSEILRCEHLSRADEFSDVSFSIAAGEILGLTGLIGSGRTELACTLFGMRQANSGCIYLNGRKVHFRSNREAIGAGVAYLPEDRLTLGLVQVQAINDNLILTVLKKIARTLSLIAPQDKNQLVNTYIKRLAIKAGNIELPVSTLSGGNQQRVVLAKWLATEPKFLILDSPTVGVDVNARAGLFKLIDELAAKGLAILLISDEVQEVYHQANRVLHMKHGEIVDTIIPSETTLEEMERAIYG